MYLDLVLQQHNGFIPINHWKGLLAVILVGCTGAETDSVHSSAVCSSMIKRIVNIKEIQDKVQANSQLKINQVICLITTLIDPFGLALAPGDLSDNNTYRPLWPCSCTR